MQILRFS